MVYASNAPTKNSENDGTNPTTRKGSKVTIAPKSCGWGKAVAARGWWEAVPAWMMVEGVTCPLAHSTAFGPTVNKAKTPPHSGHYYLNNAQMEDSFI